MTAPADGLPAYATVMLDFWGQQVPHVVLGTDDVRIVLQDAVKAFSGIDHAGTLSNKMKTIMPHYENGTCILKHLVRIPKIVFGFRSMKNRQNATLRFVLRFGDATLASIRVHR